jgi:hypothetical protein
MRILLEAGPGQELPELSAFSTFLPCEVTAAPLSQRLYRKPFGMILLYRAIHVGI